ncbi:hypothetical protein D3C87_89510 [compost metagenome]
MNINFFLRYISILFVGLLAGNAFAFVLGVGPALEMLSVGTYVEFHQAMMSFLGARAPILYAGSLMALSLSLVTMRKQWRTLEYVMVLFALICVLDELVMSVNGNLPLTRSIQSWQINQPPNNWAEVRSQWMYLMYWRCALLVSAFVLLLSASCFKDKSLSSASGVVVA